MALSEIFWTGVCSSALTGIFTFLVHAHQNQTTGEKERRDRLGDRYATWAGACRGYVTMKTDYLSHVHQHSLYACQKDEFLKHGREELKKLSNEAEQKLFNDNYALLLTERNDSYRIRVKKITKILEQSSITTEEIFLPTGYHIGNAHQMPPNLAEIFLREGAWKLLSRHTNESEKAIGLIENLVDEIVEKSHIYGPFNMFLKSEEIYS